MQNFDFNFDFLAPSSSPSTTREEKKTKAKKTTKAKTTAEPVKKKRKKNVREFIPAYQLSLPDKVVYDQLIDSTSNEKLREIVCFIDQNNMNSRGITSGRSICKFITKYAKSIDLNYFVNTDDNTFTYLPPTSTTNTTNSSSRLVNVYSEFSQYYAKYGQSRFNMFSRDNAQHVIHQCDDDSILQFSLCKVMFYKWMFEVHLNEVILDLQDDFLVFLKTNTSGLGRITLVHNNIAVGCIVKKTDP